MTAGPGRTRLDVWLVEQGLVESRHKAQALVMAGRVTVDGAPAGKPGLGVKAGHRIELVPGPAHVGRGALKLAGALEAFHLEPAGRVCLDIGASTGGFTQVLLERGARRVYAVDVGSAQLHETLRHDPRVVLREGVNARRLSHSDVPEPCSLVAIDVSFISLLKVLPALPDVCAAGTDVVALVKPQFELARRDVGRGGVVREPSLHRRALRAVAEGAVALGYTLFAAVASSIEGAEGNREFFLQLGLGAGAAGADVDRLVEAAVPGASA